MGYDLRYEAVVKYTEDGINQSKELLAFLKKRHAIEVEYTKALSKLCKGYERQVPNKRTSKKIPTPGAGNEDAEKASVESTSLQLGVWSVIEETTNMCNAHEKIALGVNATIIEPLQKNIKDLEQVRKEYLDSGFKITKSLQDHYTTLKKAKGEYDEAQKQSDELGEKNTTAQNTPNTKEKELEKISTKATQAKEKAQKLQDVFNEAELSCKHAQDQYYKQELPDLLGKFTQKEKDREFSVKSFLSQYYEIENAVLLEKTVYSSNMGQGIARIDVEEDVQDFVDDHVQDDSLGANVSVRSLMNPSKSGRLLKLLGENDWKLRYCVLMGEEQLLYMFEKEDSVKPKGLLHMKVQSVHTLDDSYFGKPHCIQIVSTDYNFRKEESKIHFFACDNEDDKREWLQYLRLSDVSKQPGRTDNDYRVVRSLKIELMEGRDLSSPDLIRRSSDPYAIVCVNQIKSAKTVVKLNTLAPFWGETFYFDDLHPRLNTLTIYVNSQSRIRIQKDSEIGKVHWSLDMLPRNKQIEEWFPLLPVSAGEGDGAMSPKESDLGAIRAKITFIEEKVLPQEHYQPLLELLTEPDMSVVRRIGEVITKEREEVARRLLKIFSNRPGGCVEFLRILTHYEINSTEDPNILFRGNSLATKAVDQYMKMFGTRFLHNTLKNLVQTVYKDTQSCEVDPTRVEKADEMKKNWKRLNGYVTSFWETIANAADKCPWELKSVFYNLQSDVMNKFNNERVKHIAVAGFVFLRFFCPAILDPSLFGMAAEHPDQNIGRTLTLVAKTLQNLANLVEFGAKEPYMGDMNQFITKNLDGMKICIEKMCAQPKADQQPSIILDVDLRRELASFYLLSGKLTELQDARTAQPDETLEKLFARLNDLGEIYSRPQTSFIQEHSVAAGDHGGSADPVHPPPRAKPAPFHRRTPSGGNYLTADNPPVPSRPAPTAPPAVAIAAAAAAMVNAAPPSVPAPAPAPVPAPRSDTPPNLPRTESDSPSAAAPPPVAPKVAIKPQAAAVAAAAPVDPPSPKPRLGLMRTKSIDKGSDNLPSPKGPPPLLPKPGPNSEMMKELASRTSSKDTE